MCTTPGGLQGSQRRRGTGACKQRGVWPVQGSPLPPQQRELAGGAARAAAVPAARSAPAPHAGRTGGALGSRGKEVPAGGVPSSLI